MEVPPWLVENILFRRVPEYGEVFVYGRGAHAYVHACLDSSRAQLVLPGHLGLPCGLLNPG